jgi:hypothetical protein
MTADVLIGEGRLLVGNADAARKKTKRHYEPIPCCLLLVVATTKINETRNKAKQGGGKLVAK